MDIEGERKHIITISGKPGSGKSTTAVEVAKLLGFAHFSSGDFMRAIARKRNVTLVELNVLAETDTSIDAEVDEALQALNERENIVIDSRLAFHWIPDSFKVYLDLEVDIAAARIFKDMDQKRIDSGEEAGTPSEVAEMINKRLNSERKRYEKLYGINPYHTAHFDLVINTERNNPATVALKVYDTYNDWLKTYDWAQVNDSVPIRFSTR